MEIEKIRIHNYRSIRDLEISCTSLVIMLGPNNHGKSNILSALDFALSTSSKPLKEDFFLFREDNELWVELTFHKLTEQECKTFEKYLTHEKTICIRKTARLREDDKIDVSYNGYVKEPTEWWLKNENIDILLKRDEIEKTPLKDYIPKTGRLTKKLISEAQKKFIEENYYKLKFEGRLETTPLLGRQNVAGGILPDFYLIPAVRDLSEETKIKGTTVFGRLLNRAVQEMADRDPQFIEIKEKLQEIIDNLNVRKDSEERPQQLIELEKNLEEELSNWGVSVSIEIEAPDITKIFELGTKLHLDDGIKTLAQYKGHGLQRAVIFALVKSWASVLRKFNSQKDQPRPRASSESVIFAMEEPELFLHPHAQRRLAKALQEISETDQHQVFITTHSTHFINLDQYKNIYIVKKESPKDGTKVLQCKEDLFPENSLDNKKKRFQMAQWINPDRGEMFFAKKVVFVEGETERVVLPFLAQRLGCYNPDISIIDCGAKHNLPLYITIANAFSLPYFVLYDEDPLPDPIPESWSHDKKEAKKRTFELNQEISSLINCEIGDSYMFSPDFETAIGISKSQGKKKGKALAALDYFDQLPLEKIPEFLKEIIYKIYQER